MWSNDDFRKIRKQALGHHQQFCLPAKDNSDEVCALLFQQLCRDWSKTKQSPTASINSEHKGKPMSTSVTKVQSQNSKESNGSNRYKTPSVIFYFFTFSK